MKTDTPSSFRKSIKCLLQYFSYRTRVTQNWSSLQSPPGLCDVTGHNTANQEGSVEGRWYKSSLTASFCVTLWFILRGRLYCFLSDLVSGGRGGGTLLVVHGFTLSSSAFIRTLFIKHGRQGGMETWTQIFYFFLRILTFFLKIWLKSQSEFQI